MKSPPETVAIVGAGPAGARLACLLAKKGKQVTLFDHKAPWEKPCGGGLSPKIMWDFPDLKKIDLKTRKHNRLNIIFPYGRRCAISLAWEILMISRKTLGEALLEDATDRGAVFRREKVTAIEQANGGSRIITDSGGYEADLVVGADGVNSIVRKTFAKKFEREDLCLTYGALLQEEVRMPIILRFFKGFRGYAWIFPRHDTTSVGIALEGGEAGPEELSARLRDFVNYEWDRVGLSPPDLGEARSWFLPALRPRAFIRPALCGDGWALVGDASGAADPLTGEGLYYAFKTADMLCRAACSESPAGIGIYNEFWNSMAALSIAKVSRVTHKFYRSTTLTALGFLMDYSPTLRDLIRSLIGGAQDYSTLKPKVKDDAYKFALETFINVLTFKKGQRSRSR